MPAVMKTIQWVGVAALLGWSTLQTFAIEGLQISVQCSNVFLTWPSVENETYIVQYRRSLTDTNGWQTLTASLAAEMGTNRTVFVHSNIVQYPNCGSSGNFLLARGGQFDLASSMLAAPPVPLAMPADGNGGAVPLALYPPGMDMSNFLIYDPVSDVWISASAYSITSASLSRLQLNGPEPMGGGSGGGDEPTQGEQPETGFYRVVRNGVHIFGMTNGMVLSGTVQLPIELSLDTTDAIAGITFYANGLPLIGASAEGDGYHWVMNWDTTMMPNGDFDITAEVDFTTQADVTNSIPVTVTVNNTISFPNYFTRNFGDQMWVYAEIATPSADYQLDLYDENTNYLGTFNGSTSDGIISFTWDLTDGNGHTFDSTNFTGVFTVTSTTMAAGKIRPLAGSSTSTATNFWAKETRWGASWNNYYVVAYGPFDGGYAASKQLLTMLGGGEGVWGGIIHTLSDYGLGSYLSPGNVDQSTAFALSNGAARTNLLNYLADPRFPNFYFFGHGSASAIGGFDPASNISFYDIKKVLGNFLTSAKPADYHPYRFVFIDGCSAGSGNFCEAFGIPAMTVNTNFFGTAGVNSRAFVGFTNTKNFNPQKWQWYSLMIGGFYEDWIGQQYSIQDCVNRALAGVHNSAQVLMDSSVVIYGAPDMMYGSP